MASPHPDERAPLRRLLSGKHGPSRPDKELILQRVLARTARPRLRLRWIGALTTAALGFAVLALWMRPAPRSDFAARGGGATPVIALSCAHDPCQAGDELRFALLGDAPARYLAVLARRSDDTVIWYFPSENGDKSLDLSTDTTSHVVNRQVLLGADHPPGRYELTAVFSPTPLGRDDVRRQLSTTLDAGVVVRRQELVIR